MGIRYEKYQSSATNRAAMRRLFHLQSEIWNFETFVG